WTAGDDDAPPESVDGWFWVWRGEAGRFAALLVSGVREGRPGFSIVPLPDAEPGEAAAVLEGAGSGGASLRSRMPGAELEGLYQVRTAGEALGVFARTLALLTDLGVDPPAERSPADARGPRPSRLAYRRVKLDRWHANP